MKTGMRRLALVGAGMIPFREHFDMGWEEMIQRAYLAALASVDKGVDPAEIDGGFIGCCRPGLHGHQTQGGVALPGIIAATIFAFTVSWADFLYPMAFTTSADQLVLPAGIVTILIRGDVYAWGQIMAACLLGALPPLLIYAFLMDYYIAGLTAGATKG